MRSLFKSFPFKIILALFSGILMGLTPAPMEAWGFAWIALIPLWILVVKAVNEKHSIRKAIAYGLAWGFGYHGLALFWITGVHPMDWMGVPWLASLAIAAFCWIFITLWGAGIVIAWSVAMVFLMQTPPFENDLPKSPTSPYPSGRGNIRMLRSYILGTFKNFSAFKLPSPSGRGAGGEGLRARGDLSASLKFKTETKNVWLRLLLGVAIWCGLEAFWGLGNLYWSSISYTQSPHNLAILHLGQLSGPLTITAAIVIVNGLLAEGIIQIKRHYFELKRQDFIFWLLAIALFCLFHLIGWELYSRPLSNPPENAIKVGIIQGNIPNTIKLYPQGWVKAIQGYTQGYRDLANQGVEAILTPETALPFNWAANPQNYHPLQHSFYDAVLEENVLVWVGGYNNQGNTYTNSLFTLTGRGNIISRYDKFKLVPLGEYIPFQPILGNLINRLSPLEANLVPGKPNQTFNTPFGQAIVSICYESAFPQVFRRQAAKGGEFILSSSNDAHYSETMPRQHHAQDIMRSIETDRWAVRATNTGYSAIVNPHGETQWISEMNQYQIHADTIYRRQTKTLYVRWGNWLTLLLLGLGAIAFIISWIWHK